MSGRQEEGFDWLPSNPSSSTVHSLMLARGWYFPLGSNWTLSIQTGRYGYGGRLRFFQNGLIVSSCAILPIGSHETEGYYAVGVKIGSASSGNSIPYLTLYDLVNNVHQVQVRFTGNGVVEVWSGNTHLGSSDAGQWHYDEDFDVEIHGLVNSSTGVVEVRIHTIGSGASGAGSTPAIHLSNVNTNASGVGTFDGIGFGYQAAFPFTAVTDGYVDDLRFYDTAGAINNAWLGTCRVQTLLAAGDGSTLDFTRSNTGLAAWQNIGNRNVDDSLYLYDPTVSDYNLSTPQPLVNSPTVFWLGMAGFYRQDDATQRFAKNRIVSSGTTADGVSFATPQSYLADHDVFELDPHTGLQFTGSGVNALQFGPLVFA